MIVPESFDISKEYNDDELFALWRYLCRGYGSVRKALLLLLRENIELHRRLKASGDTSYL